VKFYAVAVGRQPGVYHTWAECKAQVDGIPKAKFKAFKNIKDANMFCGEHPNLTSPNTVPSRSGGPEISSLPYIASIPVGSPLPPFRTEPARPTPIQATGEKRKWDTDSAYGPRPHELNSPGLPHSETVPHPYFTPAALFHRMHDEQITVGYEAEAVADSPSSQKTQTEELPALIPINPCIVCQAQGKFLCGKCSKVVYCGRNCQEVHWVRDHQNYCTFPPQRGNARSTSGGNTVRAGLLFLSLVTLICHATESPLPNPSNKTIHLFSSVHTSSPSHADIRALAEPRINRSISVTPATANSTRERIGQIFSGPTFLADLHLLVGSPHTPAQNRTPT